MEENRLREGVLAILNATGDENPTAAALKDYLNGTVAAETLRGLPFRSEVKWSGCRTAAGESWVLGAGSFVFPEGWSLEGKAEEYAEQGLRVLCVGVSEADFGTGDALPENLRPAGLIVLADTLRPGAEETVDYFKRQGVALKLISGDDPRTVSALARRVWAGVFSLDISIGRALQENGQEISQSTWSRLASTCAHSARVRVLSCMLSPFSLPIIRPSSLKPFFSA